MEAVSYEGNGIIFIKEITPFLFLLIKYNETTAGISEFAAKETVFEKELLKTWLT